jgi:hypothetical protein
MPDIQPNLLALAICTVAGYVLLTVFSVFLISLVLANNITAWTPIAFITGYMR